MLDLTPTRVKELIEKGYLHLSQELTKGRRKKLENLGLEAGFRNYSNKSYIKRTDIVEFSKLYPNLVGKSGSRVKLSPISRAEKSSAVAKQSNPKLNERRPDIIDVIDAICEKDGAISEVGPDYYQIFSQLDDDSMRALIRVLLLNSSKDAYRLGAKPDGKQQVCKSIKTQLELVGLGIMQVDTFGRPGLYKRVGPDATKAESEKIETRINSAEKIVSEVVEDLLPAMLASFEKQSELGI